MKDVNLVEFGNNVRAERNRIRMTQEKLAELAGLIPQHVSRIENGEIDIQFSTLVSLLKALNIPFEKVYDLKLK